MSSTMIVLASQASFINKYKYLKVRLWNVVQIFISIINDLKVIWDRTWAWLNILPVQD